MRDSHEERCSKESGKPIDVKDEHIGHRAHVERTGCEKVQCCSLTTLVTEHDLTSKLPAGISTRHDDGVVDYQTTNCHLAQVIVIIPHSVLLLPFFFFSSVHYPASNSAQTTSSRHTIYLPIESSANPWWACLFFI